jgi:hypothetical protein
VGYIKVSPELFPVQLVGTFPVEFQINNVYWWGGEFLLPKDHAAVNIVQKLIVFI